MGVSYGLASLGSAITTCISSSSSAPATVPATLVSGLACIDNLNEAEEYLIRKKVIKELIKSKN